MAVRHLAWVEVCVAEDDKARFYVIDGSFQRLVGKCWKFVPDWFKDALPESFVPGSQTRET